jgi:hypothetical protein
VAFMSNRVAGGGGFISKFLTHARNENILIQSKSSTPIYATLRTAHTSPHIDLR